MELRPYQIQAVSAAMYALECGQHPVIALPTGSGKSAVIAALCQSLPGRILVVTHAQELVRQNAEECAKYDPTQDIGVFSAGLKKRETTQRILFAGVQSIWKRMDAIQASGDFTYVLIDEAHAVTPQTADAKQCNAVLAACQGAQRVGLSATPFRLDDGPIYGEYPCWFNTIATTVGIRDLTPEYLAPLRGILTAHDVDVSAVKTQHGDFATRDVARLVNKTDVVDAAIAEVRAVAARRKKILTFCVDIDHCTLVVERLMAHGETAAMVTAKTPLRERQRLLDAFHAGYMRFLVNCETLTTGFNVPDIDALWLLRPTQSKGLLIQMLGRGTRQAQGKHDCLVLDMAGNLERHIPLDEIVDTFETPHRRKKTAERQRQEEEKQKQDAQEEEQHPYPHQVTASEIDPMAGSSPALTAVVIGWYFRVEPSKNPKYSGKSIIKILYRVAHEAKWITTFLCPEYSGWHRGQTEKWCTDHGGPVAISAQTLYHGTTLRQYRMPARITFRKQGKYYTLLQEHYPRLDEA